jgi:hypothetical protein
MKKIWISSATFLSTLGILGLVILGFRDADVAVYIAMIAIGHAGTRAFEGIKTPKE